MKGSINTTDEDIESSETTSIIRSARTIEDGEKEEDQPQENADGKDDYPEIVLLSYPQALKKTFLLAYPFCLSRLALVAQRVGNGIIFAHIGDTEVAAGTFIDTFQYAVIGTMRGGLLSTGIVVGKANGRKNFHEIGNIIRQSWIIGTGLSVFAVVIFLNTGRILRVVGVSDPISSAVESYFFSFNFSVLATLWLACDQQFALGIKRSPITMIAGSCFAFLSMLFGYPLALGSFGLPKLGTGGLGYGATISAWLTLLGLRLYYGFNKDFRKFNLFKIQFREMFKKFSKLLKLCVAMGIQFFSEWGNLFAISLISGRLGKDVLAAEQVSLLMMTSFYHVMLSLGQASGVAVSNTIGTARLARKKGNLEDVQICLKNVRTLGNCGIIWNFSSSILACGICVGIPKQLTSIFTYSSSHSAAENDEIVVLAQSLLLINGLGLLVDSIRNASSGALSGLRDVIFSPFFSFLTMSLMGLSVGFGLTEFLDWGAGWLFITRDVGILLAAVAIAIRWLYRSSLSHLTADEERRAIRKNLPKSERSTPNCLTGCWQRLFKPETIEISQHTPIQSSILASPQPSKS